MCTVVYIYASFMIERSFPYYSNSENTVSVFVCAFPSVIWRSIFVDVVCVDMKLDNNL